jgi:formylglycine-generating enzyme required for sulfatase activity
MHRKYFFLALITTMFCSLFFSLSCNSIYNPPEKITILLPGDLPLELVRIKAGIFMMGSSEAEKGHEEDEKPVHNVTLTSDFYIGSHEVTQAQWLALMGSWPDSSQPKTEEGLGDDYPAYYISWNDCQEYISLLNEYVRKTHQGNYTFRLPSEAEWEYACRAGTQTRFFFGDSLIDSLSHQAGDYMWYKDNNEPTGTKPVGKKLPNAWGLYDMHGNVWEWCQDWYHTSYEGAPTDGSAWESPVTEFRILHGGDWDNEARTCRSANRNDHRGPDDRSADLGFRIVAMAIKE